MSKFSVVYVKQHPFMFGTIFVVFGLFLWLMLNRGASSASDTSTIVNAGPSDAQVAGQVALGQVQLESATQIQLAQIAANTAVQQMGADSSNAGLAIQFQMAQLQSDHDLGSKQIDASLAALTAQLANTYSVQHDNNAFMLDYARAANDAATAQLMIGAHLQEVMGAQQLDGFKFSSAISQLGSLKKGDRDNALISLTLGLPSSHGSVIGTAPATNWSGLTQYPTGGMTAA